MTAKQPSAREALDALGVDPDAIRDQIGYNEAGDPADELRHFYLCQACQQPVDKRDLGAVLHHEEPGHEPLPPEDTVRLYAISELLKATLER